MTTNAQPCQHPAVTFTILLVKRMETGKCAACGEQVTVEVDWRNVLGSQLGSERERFDALVESMCGALRFDREETEDAENWPLINLPELANGIRNRLDKAEGELATTRASNATLSETVSRYRTALDFYAAEANWRTSSRGFAALYDPEPPKTATDYGAIARAALQDAAVTKQCPDCDGCGWTEGGTALKTTCDRCNGTGAIPNADLSPSPTTPDPARLHEPKGFVAHESAAGEP